MAGMDDIDLFGAPPVTGSTRDRDLDRLERMVRGRYIDPLEQKAKDMVKNQVVQALSGIEGFTGAAIAQVVALADSPDPNDKLVFNQIASRLNLPINIRRMGDDYMASKRFEGALGRNSSVDVSAYRPDEGETQYSLSAQKRFPNFLGKNSSAGVSARVSTMGDPEIGARFEKRFADGGEVDIFEAEAPRRSPDAYRRDGSLKSQTGLIGPIINKHSGKPMTELSIGVEIGGREVEIPSMVPTLTEEERILLQNLRIGVDPMPKSIVIKAKRHAMERIKSGLSPFLPAEPQNMNLGGSVSTMMGRTPEPSLPKLSEAQIANLSASFVPGAATTDIFGEFPEFPASDVSVKEMLGGQRAPSLAKNIKEGEYLSAGLQGLGGIGDLAYAIPLAGPAIASVLKAPRALQKVLDLSRRVEDASDIFGEGAKRVRLTDKETGGTIELLERQDGSASVIELQVPEEFRGQGVGEALQAKALAEYPNMQGQVSSKAAATTAYRLGRRPYGNPDATLDDVFAQIDEMSSVNLISPERQLALDPNAFKGTDRLAKAQKAGFDTETVYYHATDKFEGDASDQEFTKILPSERGKLGPGIYLSPNPRYSETYINEKSFQDPKFGRGSRVLPVFVRGKVGTREDFGEAIESVKKNASDKTDFAVIKRQAQEKMADDGFAGFKVQDELVIFDPKNVRSVNAKFEDLDSPELLKAEGGAIDINDIDIFAR